MLNSMGSIQWAQSFQSIQWAQHHILNSIGSSESIFDGPKFESNVIANVSFARLLVFNLPAGVFRGGMKNELP